MYRFPVCWEMKRRLSSATNEGNSLNTQLQMISIEASGEYTDQKNVAPFFVPVLTSSVIILNAPCFKSDHQNYISLMIPRKLGFLWSPCLTKQDFTVKEGAFHLIPSDILDIYCIYSFNPCRATTAEGNILPFIIQQTIFNATTVNHCSIPMKQ